MGFRERLKKQKSKMEDRKKRCEADGRICFAALFEISCKLKNHFSYGKHDLYYDPNQSSP